MMIRTLVVAFAVAGLIAVSASSQGVSYLEFGKGPAQWIMTSQEQRAWRAVKTEEEARDFADLFWARRDPTPGTPVNEFRLQFESRVTFADQHFQEGKRRGALTDRGRVLITLGFPPDMSAEIEKGGGMPSNDIETVRLDRGGAVIPTGESMTGNRTLAAKDTWNYTHEQAEKFGLPKIEVVFLHEPNGHVRRDPQRTDFTSALPGAIKSYIVSPDLKEVPEWASSRIETVVLPAASIVAESVATTTVTRTVVDAPAAAARLAGAGKLTLVRDINTLQPQSGADPFASIPAVTSFKGDQDLGWTAEYCAGAVLSETPPVKVQLRISGRVRGQPVNMVSEPEEFVPDSIKASPGCYLVRGSLPLAGMDPGTYTLAVTISGPGEQQRYNLTREFRIE